MFAIIETGGKQYRVQPEDIIEVEKIKVDQGDNFDIDSVLAVSDDEGIKIGAPYVENAVVKAEVLEHGKGDKIIIYKYKPKKKYRKKKGHRQPFTRIKINDILLNQTVPVEEVQEEEVTEVSDQD